MEILESLPDDLQPEEQKLFDVVYRGLALFLTRFGLKRQGMTPRSEASNIHDCMVEIARELFPDPGHQVIRNLFVIKMGPYRIKLKMLDGNFQTRNHRTQMVLQFLRNVPARLFDMEPTINLHLGYQKHGVELMKSAIFLTRPDGNRIKFVYELLPPAVSAAPPIPSQLPVPAPVAGRVKAKPISKDLPKADAADESKE